MNAHRANIISILQITSSPDEALEYQRKAPLVNVAHQLVNHWFDFYHPGSAQFESAFSRDELTELAQLHRLFDAKVEELPNDLGALLKSSAWVQVSSEASGVLDRMGWTGVDARYDD